ncbi:STAS domain-containing protein [Streptomyces sp. NPDC086787]|uniref:STAS domain-containing protein n=1 Tax=Streptomyces sp. NPDC086787 TaxID=3365759 RepID=UPI003811BFD7
MHTITDRRPATADRQLQNLVITMSPPGERVLVTISGELDITTERAVESTLRKALSDNSRAVDLDLTEVSFCDCSGLRALMAARHRALDLGRTMTIRAAGIPVQRLLNITGAETLFTLPPHLPHTPSGH